MIVGTQFVAPEGYECLAKGHTYHFLASDQSHDRVLFVEFVKAKNGEHRSLLLALGRAHFELGLELGRKSAKKKGIVLVANQNLLPPWLMYRIRGTGANVSIARDMSEDTAAVVKQRLAWILPLTERLKEIFGARNPERLINAYARTVTNSKGKLGLNETRVRHWLSSYLVFGRDEIALAPPYGENGKWSRREAENAEKLGRHHHKGEHYGHNAAPLVATMLDGYDAHRKRGRTLVDVYGFVVTDKELFGCLARNASTKNKKRQEFYHPEGKAFPSVVEFRYHMEVELGRRILERSPDPDATISVIRKWGRMQLRIDRGGSARERIHKFESTGSFTDDLGFLMERVKCDAYWVKELPRSLTGGDPLPPLIVVRARCVTSGRIVGIGFSLGGEIGAAYDCMMFSMVVNKVFYCSLFGLTIGPSEWEGVGRPAAIEFDRGPAGAAGFNVNKLEKVHLHGLSPSYSPLSNSPVEASHPRDLKEEGKPTFVESNMTLPELIKRELLRAIYDNKTFDVSHRVIDGRTFGTPDEIWTYLSNRARNMAEPMAFDAAVRTYLTKKEFAIRPDGAYLHESRFDSPKLRATKVLEKANTRKESTLTGYIVDYGVNKAWLDIPKRGLVEVTYTPATRTHKRYLYPSLVELEQQQQSALEVMRDFDQHIAAARAERNARVREETGKGWQIAAR